MEFFDILSFGKLEYKKSSILATESCRGFGVIAWIYRRDRHLGVSAYLFMKLLFVLTILGIALGQLGAIPLGNNMTLYVHDVFLAALLVFAVFTKQIKVQGALLVPIRFFFSIAIVSLAVNASSFAMTELGVSSLYLWRWILYSGLYFVALEPVISWKQWLRWTYWSGVLVAGLGLFQYVYYPYLRNLSYLGWDPHLYRVFSTFLDPNYLSLYLVLTLFLGMYLYDRTVRFVYMFGQLVTFVALLLTYSRSGFIALLVGVFVYALLQRKLKVVVIGTVVFAALLLVLPKTDGEGVKLFRTVSTFARIGNWQRGFILIQESPIFGFGFNTVRYVQQRRGWVDAESIIPSKAGAGLDDSFQFLWATTGIVGLLSYLWILVSMGKIFVRLLGNGKTRVLGVIGISALLSTIVHSQFINSLFYPQILAWWWIVSAALERSFTVGMSHGAQPLSDSPPHPSRRSLKYSRRLKRSSDR